MAAPILTQKSTSHTRSISLPSRTHPSNSTVEQQLCALKARAAASTPSSLSSACHMLSDLKDLYQCVDDMLHTKVAQSLFSDQRDECIEDVLDRSIRLLDVGSTIRDILSQMRGSVQTLESSLRRRRGVECCPANEISDYMVSRKKVKKMAGKCIGNLRKLVRNYGSAHLVANCNHGAMIGVLREVEEISFPVLKSLLTFVSKTKAPSSWLLVSKLIQPKHVAREGEQQNCNEVDKIDAALGALKCQSNPKQVQNLLKPLEALESSIQDIDEELDGVLRYIDRTTMRYLYVCCETDKGNPETRVS
ncbi:hypothetical protein RJ640_020751 [Escallonia rubra]|uniref:Uncharacterized protein n=1 Tax=Escallonia rubra TaxID=112253 RepID=A0AA88S9X1_9ASTE|nr:hypothetical protein RJ640_020751 [Escallonia rubra]